MTCCCGCCCVNGSPDPTKTTKQTCEAVGGVWQPRTACDPSPCAGACCKCGPLAAFGTVGSGMSSGFGPKPTTDSLHAYYNTSGWTSDAQTIANWLSNHGYQCVTVQPPSLYGPVDIDAPPWTWQYQWFGPVVRAKCCGYVEGCETPYWFTSNNTWQGGQPIQWDDNGFCPCIPDAASLTCVEQTKAECEADCGSVWHSGAVCQDSPCDNQFP